MGKTGRANLVRLAGLFSTLAAEPAMTVFEDLFGDLYADADLAVDGVYTPAAAPGSPFAVRVMRARPQEAIGGFGGRVVAEAVQLSVRRAQVAQPAVGDLIAVGAETFKVMSWSIDGERIEWRLAVEGA